MSTSGSSGSDDEVRADRAARWRAARLLRVRTIWVTPIVLAALLIFLITLFYVGSVVNPVSHLSSLPVALVNEDSGATVLGQRVNIGDDIASGLQRSHAVSSRVTLDTGSLSQAQAQMRRDGAYATIVIPSNLTTSLLSAYGLAPQGKGKPSIQLLTNPRAGSIGVELATGVAEPALHSASVHVGQQLSAEAAKAGRTSSSAIQKANPITVTTTEFWPLPPNSALGLSAFYISLLAIMSGFLGAILVNSTVDAALGYGTTEIGPKWSQRTPVAITRWETLKAKWTVTLAAAPLLTGVLLLVAVVILKMDAPYVWLLWLFISFAASAIAIGTLALFAAFGTLGQMVAMLLFVYLALASSGGTIPVQALPPALRFVAGFEPLRQVLDGVRSILYFGASGDAGLTRGLVLTAIGLVFWLLVGFAVTKWYDRRGLERIQPDLLEFVQRSAATYAAESSSGAGGA
jgi:YhgE/Pip-like protein